MKDPSKKRQPCKKRREIAKLSLRALKLIKYLWLAYKSTDLIDFVVALLEEVTGPLDHYLPREV